MTTCPKCGGIRISGPVYIRAVCPGGREALRYRCIRCGYSEDQPTVDQRKEEDRRG